MNSWIDVHTHINMLDTTPEKAIEDALANGVERLITIGTTPDDLPIVEALAQKFKPQVYCTLGIHPHDAELWSSKVQEYLEAHLSNDRVVAVGEIGLDYFYKNSEPALQLVSFRAQMELAAKFQLPVEIHTRDAEADTLVVLKEFSGRVTGLLHCFTSSWDLAREALALGYHISFSGVVTFKNADDLREVCRKVPLDRIHVETDAPFLAPVPHRGQKNRPSLVVHTAEVVAQLKGVSLSELAVHTKRNALQLFPRLEWT